MVTEQDRTTALLDGDVDILFSVSAYDCDKLKLSDNVTLLQSPSSKIEYLSLNTKFPPFDNQKIRLA
ncbi:ABC transporter substrate-binding protein, partial [Clostridioides difficile]|uniref:ABC transporter substrate-binding protein n=1 Tax=Clostridioides difficile TaxID=1496 RepID=UPI0034DD2772